MNKFTVTYTVGGEHGPSATTGRLEVESSDDPPLTGLWKVTNHEGRDQWINVGRVSSIWRVEPIVHDSPKDAA